MEEENVASIIHSVPSIILDMNDDNSHDSNLISIPIEDTDDEDEFNEHDENLLKKQCNLLFNNKLSEDNDSQDTVIYSPIFGDKNKQNEGNDTTKNVPVVDIIPKDEPIDYDGLQAELETIERLEQEVLKNIDSMECESQSIINDHEYEFINHDVSHLIEDLRETEPNINDNVDDVPLFSPSTSSEHEENDVELLQNFSNLATQVFNPHDIPVQELIPSKEIEPTQIFNPNTVLMSDMVNPDSVIPPPNDIPNSSGKTCNNDSNISDINHIPDAIPPTKIINFQAIQVTQLFDPSALQMTQLFEPNAEIVKVSEKNDEPSSKDSIEVEKEPTDKNDIAVQETQIFEPLESAGKTSDDTKVVNEDDNSDIDQIRCSQTRIASESEINIDAANEFDTSIKIKEEEALNITDNFLTSMNYYDSDDDLCSIFMDHSYLSQEEVTNIKNNQKSFRLSQSFQEEKETESSSIAFVSEDIPFQSTQIDLTMDKTTNIENNDDTQKLSLSPNNSDLFDIKRWLDFIESKIDLCESSDLENQIKFVKDMTQFVVESESFDLVDYIKSVDDRIESIREKIKLKSLPNTDVVKEATATDVEKDKEEENDNKINEECDVDPEKELSPQRENINLESNEKIISKPNETDRNDKIKSSMVVQNTSETDVNYSLPENVSEPLEYNSNLVSSDLVSTENDSNVSTESNNKVTIKNEIFDETFKDIIGNDADVECDELDESVHEKVDDTVTNVNVCSDKIVEGSGENRVAADSEKDVDMKLVEDELKTNSNTEKVITESAEKQPVHLDGDKSDKEDITDVISIDKPEESIEASAENLADETNSNSYTAEVDDVSSVYHKFRQLEIFAKAIMDKSKQLGEEQGAIKSIENVEADCKTDNTIDNDSDKKLQEFVEKVCYIWYKL